MTPGEGGATPVRIAAAKSYLEHNARCLFGKRATTISRAHAMAEDFSEVSDD